MITVFVGGAAGESWSHNASAAGSSDVRRAANHENLPFAMSGEKRQTVESTAAAIVQPNASSIASDSINEGSAFAECVPSPEARFTATPAFTVNITR